MEDGEVRIPQWHVAELADFFAAGDELLEANLHLVVAIAKRFADRRVPFADLVQAGHRGLVRARQKYDPAGAPSTDLS